MLAFWTGAAFIGTILPAYGGDWTVAPRIGGQELFTTNVLLTPTNERSDFITSLSPGINVSGTSSRLQGTLDYSPTLYRYALTPGQDTIAQNLYANGTATLVPNTFFVDARGYASMQPINPGLMNGSLGTAAPILPTSSFSNIAQGIPKAQLAQVLSFSVSPYLAHRFDGIGSAELRYTLSNTNFSGNSGSISTVTGTPFQNTTNLTNEATAAFKTGENFGPLAGQLVFDAAQSEGTGEFNNAHHYLVTLDSGYAINRRLTILGTIGHEDIRFNGIPTTLINDVVWNVGLRATPSPATIMTATYGHQNGITAPYFALVYNVSGMTVLSATYSEGVTTIAQQIASDLAVSDVNNAGQLVDTRTLLPLSLVNPVIGLQSGVLRTKQFNGTASISWPRDHLNASIQETENALIAQNTAGSGTSQTAIGANVNWSRDISPITTANVGVGYTHYNFPSSTQAEENLFTANASISYMLNVSLTGWLGYNFLDRTSANVALAVKAHTIYAGLRKTF